MEIDGREYGELSIKMLDILETDLSRKSEDNGVSFKIGLIHIAVEVEFETEDDGWTEVYVQSNERRGWVKEAFLHRLAEYAERMQNVEAEVEPDDDEND